MSENDSNKLNTCFKKNLVKAVAVFAIIFSLSLNTAFSLYGPRSAIKPKQVLAQTTQLRIGIDADSTGNSATSLDSIDSCGSTNTDTNSTIDIFVENATNLISFGTYLEYDPQVLNVVGSDTQMFLKTSEAGSSVNSSSHTLNPSLGLYYVGATQTGQGISVSGSGVLARVTIKALKTGTTPLKFYIKDLNSDGKIDISPFLRNSAGDLIGDDNNDTVFDRPILDASIFVDQPCPNDSNNNNPTDNDNPIDNAKTYLGNNRLDTHPDGSTGGASPKENSKIATKSATKTATKAAELGSELYQKYYYVCYATIAFLTFVLLGLLILRFRKKIIYRSLSDKSKTSGIE